MGVDDGAPVLLSTTAALSNPPAIDYAYFCQGEQFLVIQAGDNTTLPLFWDGSILRRSDGQSVNLGVTSADFTAPAQLGDSALITLSAPFWQGHDNQVFTINGESTATWIQVRGNQFITLKNIAAATGTLAAGSQIVRNGVDMSKLISQFTIPAVAASNNVFVTPAYTGAVNDFVTIGGLSFQITAIGIPDVGSPQIRAVNLNQATGTANPHPVSLTSVQEIGAAGPMDYFMGRLWYAIARQYLAGDIVRGPSGTAFYDYRDSILKVTENPLCLAGDGFTVPDNAGNIRALFHNANINTTLGQGQLYIGTRKAIYSLDVPVSRSDWIATNGNSKAATQTVVQLANGPVNDRSVAKVNGDIWFQNLEPNIASLFTTVRNFTQWGNISLSANEQRILQFNDRALMRFSSGVYFYNRLLETALPRQLPQGVVHDAIIPLDFVPLSSFGASLMPNWEGHYQGLQVLQMFSGDFGGRQRAFAAVVSTINGDIELWEMTDLGKFDVADTAGALAAKMSGQPIPSNRIQCYAETASFTFGDVNQMKELLSVEIGIDRLFGTVEFRCDYRPDSDACWHLLHEWQECSAKDSCEENVSCYPAVPKGEGYKMNVTLPKPQEKCAPQSSRPVSQGFQFQIKLSWKGFCRIRSIRLYAKEIETKLYRDLADL